MGNTAALLPAQPNTTWDWIERMRFIDITAEKIRERRNISDEEIALLLLCGTNRYLAPKITIKR
jgi:hypothetical protein